MTCVCNLKSYICGNSEADLTLPRGAVHSGRFNLSYGWEVPFQSPAWCSRNCGNDSRPALYSITDPFASLNPVTSPT
jgi:hypothetical protein